MSFKGASERWAVGERMPLPDMRPKRKDGLGLYTELNFHSRIGGSHQKGVALLFGPEFRYKRTSLFLLSYAEVERQELLQLYKLKYYGRMKENNWPGSI